MPFKYNKNFELSSEEVEKNYAKEKHHAYPPGFMSAGKATRSDAARLRQATLEQHVLDQELSTVIPMTFTVDLTNAYEIKFYIDFLTDRLKYLEDHPHIVPDPFAFDV